VDVWVWVGCNFKEFVANPQFGFVANPQFGFVGWGKDKEFVAHPQFGFVGGKTKNWLLTRCLDSMGNTTPVVSSSLFQPPSANNGVSNGYRDFRAYRNATPNGAEHDQIPLEAAHFAMLIVSWLTRMIVTRSLC
jgi:hypothetical protein